MKNIYIKLISKLMFVCVFFLQTGLKGQTFNFTVNPSIQCTSGSTVFVAAGITSSMAGATSYSWSITNNNSSVWISWTQFGLFAQGWGMNIGSTGIITCYALNNGVILSSVAHNYSVGVPSNPMPSIVASSNTFCAGSSVTLTAINAMGPYWYSINTQTNAIVVTPSVGTCYTVLSQICNNTATICLIPIPLPNITILGSNTVCYGSSLSFTATGANAYSWGSNTTTILALISFPISVIGTNTLTSCQNTASASFTINPNCAIVWPGDANRDGLVDNTDVFEIGLAMNNTGPSRAGATNNWIGQYASTWTGTISSGWNKVHADCNGDGTINLADTIPIHLNYLQLHSFKPNNNTAGIDLFLNPQKSEVYGGVWNVFDVILGDASNSQSQLYGAAFDLEYDQNMVYQDSVRLIYTSSYLNAGNQNVQFAKKNFTNGKYYAASVRTDHNAVNGNGKIAELWVKLRNNIPDNSSFVFGISNGKRTNAAGNMGILSTSGSMNLNVNNNATGIQEKFVIKNLVNFYPNPANQNIIIQCNSGTKTNFRLLDITGRCVMTGDVTGIKSFDISALQQGVYVFEFDTQNGKIQKKLIKE